ncbi:MAG: serine/threonine-protein kinase [Bryobacteraceae bacterium]|nr:serine/threonine-protein kinase [Bryobacteraceae bacterium]
MEAGQRIGDYEILQVLGAGGMGKVYKVKNVLSERVEAMKVLLPNLESEPDLVDRFLREIKVQAALEHPNIANLRTAAQVGNQLLMIMEFVEGQSLDALLKQGPLPPDKAVNYACQVLSALEYAHGRGVVHRDLKPPNIMLTPLGVVKLMDFGIARLLVDRKLTQTGRTLGSLFYMSPEQINGVPDLDGRSDLYSLGITLYELVTGRRPFQGDSDFSIMAAHLQQQPPPPIELHSQIPQALNDAILIAIAKERSQRFQSATAMRRALENVASMLAGDAPTETAAAAPARAAVVPEPKKFSSRGIYIGIGSAATIAVLVLAATQLPRFFSTKAEGPSTPPVVAEQQAPQPVPQQAAQPEPAAPEVKAQPDTPAPEPAAVPAQSKPDPQPQTVSAAAAKTRPAVAVPAVAAQVQAQPPLQPPSQPPPAAVQPTNPPPNPATAKPAVDTAALNESKERLNQFGMRAAAIKRGLSNFQQSQARMGLSLRGDIVSANQRMEYQLDLAEAALRANDPVTAKKHLENAEREMEKLERFLNL